jgi:hypothetical protein
MGVAVGFRGNAGVGGTVGAGVVILPGGVPMGVIAGASGPGVSGVGVALSIVTQAVKDSEQITKSKK